MDDVEGFFLVYRGFRVFAFWNGMDLIGWNDLEVRMSSYVLLMVDENYSRR